VRSYLSRLEKLLPDSDRVAQMKVYFRDTTTMLNNQGSAKAP
jgi:DICT domain-containing protein